MRDEVYLQSARIGQALASPQRLRLLNRLAQRPHTVGQLAEILGESKASTSAHLKVLRAACLVEDERRGREVWCRLASDEVAALLVKTRAVAEQLLPELGDVVRAAAVDPTVLTGATLSQVVRNARAGRVRLLDLRPADEFEAGHLPTAASLPLSLLESRSLAELRREYGQGDVVAYCRGPWCVMAAEGVDRLKRAGVSVRRLPAGVTEWRAEGRKLATR